ncbi:MAG: FAD-dependent oxidoreductase, partial [Rhodobacterales bacterium]|nr:FAD-dependent oxidoreductase [Rhodobacterales bacterium]
MAGLGAARALADAGAQVTVIEARDRIGGRSHTSHLWPDLPMDMGAGWIHGTSGNPVTALAHKVGLTLTPTSYKRSVTFDAAVVNLDLEAMGAQCVGGHAFCKLDHPKSDRGPQRRAKGAGADIA